MPSAAVPLLLFDANARFSENDGDLLPENANAHHWLALMHAIGLAHTGIRGSDAQPLSTWRSPNGVEACLDYIAMASLTCAQQSFWITLCWDRP